MALITSREALTPAGAVRAQHRLSLTSGCVIKWHCLRPARWGAAAASSFLLVACGRPAMNFLRQDSALYLLPLPSLASLRPDAGSNCQPISVQPLGGGSCRAAVGDGTAGPLPPRTALSN